jgi:anti-sigma-K factor RskA
MTDDPKETMLDLLCKKAVYGLSEKEQQQLTGIQRQLGIDDDSLSLEMTAAAIGMAGLDKTEEMPASLREKILADAEKHVGVTAGVPRRIERSSDTSWFGWMGWAFAAAASIALAFNLYYTGSPTTVVTGPSPTPTPEERLTPLQMRLRLIETAPDLARGSWGAGNVKNVSPAGDIVWSDSKQAGYMRLSGLPVNDPNRETYQLWIFDETQDEATPIDGGTFDVSESGEIVVPIDAKLRPRNTKMYAITIEKPGGVVRSDRKRLVALAKRET